MAVLAGINLEYIISAFKIIPFQMKLQYYGLDTDSALDSQLNILRSSHQS